MNDNLISEKNIALSIAQEILLSRVTLPSIPGNMQRMFDMVRRPQEKIDIPELAKLVEADPGLFTLILQLANSMVYGEMEKIVTLRAAITRIGLQETVNAVTFHFFREFLPKFPSIKGFSYNDFWAFSRACAVANRRLGHPSLRMDVMPGDLYMAGILQGLGKLLMAIHFKDEFTGCIERARRLECSLHEVEREVFGTTDNLVAARVLRTWQLPANIVEGVGFCRMPEKARPEYIVVAGLTQFAYSIAEMSGMGASGDGIRLPLSETFLGGKPNLALSKPAVQSALVDEILKDLEEKDIITSLKRKPAAGRTVPNARPKAAKGISGFIKSLFGRSCSTARFPNLL